MLCALAGTFGILQSAQAQTLTYQNDFESGSGSNWYSNVTTTPTNEVPALTKFLGRYTSNQGVQLTITPGAGDSSNSGGGGSGGSSTSPINYTVIFDLYLFDNWVGNASGYAEHMQMSVNNSVLFDNAFSNNASHPEWQTYPKSPSGGFQQLGGSTSYLDAVYRNVSVSFTALPTDTIVLKWKSQGLPNDLTNASWGLDNVRINSTTVPAPGTLALLGSGGMLAGRRRRRGN
jgi:hypothetical protein